MAEFVRAYHGLQVFESGAGFGGFVGLSSHNLVLTGDFGSASDDVDVFSLGPVIGGEFRWYSRVPFHIFARLTLSLEVADNRQSVTTRGLELGGAYHFSRYLDLAAGFRSWKYEADSDGDFESDIELNVDGPFVTLGFSF